MKLTFKLEVITPEIAREMMQHNENNRQLRDARVSQYADLMKRGLWTVHHQGIAFGADGSLYDGQHRLAAVIKSGVSVTMVVARGFESQARMDMDRHEARSAADNAKMVHGCVITNTESAACRILWSMFEGGSDRRTIPTSDLMAVWRKYAPGIAAVRKLVTSPIRRLSKGSIMAGFIFAHATNPAVVEQAVDDFHSGAGLEAGDPILTLRNAFFEMRNQSQGEDFKRVLSAIAARLDGRKLSKSVVKDGTRTGPVIERFSAANGVKAKATASEAP